MRLILLTASAALALPSAALAAPGGGPATINGTASAEVIAPLQIQCGPMHWGTLAPLASPTWVKMNPSGFPLDDPSNVVVPGTVDSAQPGHCDVRGEIGMTFNVTLPTVETLNSGTHSMTLTEFVISTDDDANPLHRTLEDVFGVGTNGFNVGAKLNVGADQAVGYYSGTYTVSVQYN